MNEVPATLIDMREIAYYEGYKYLTGKLYSMKCSFAPEHDVKTEFGEFRADGWLIIYSKYSSDGPSGPTWDTDNIMRCAFVHDFLYQLLRMQKIPKSFRKKADQLYRKIARQDGTGKFRAWYQYRALRWKGRKSASPKSRRKLKYAP